MNAILAVVSSLGLVIGSLVTATVLCWLLWRVFVATRHPDWAPGGIAILVALALTGNLPGSPFLQLALAFSVAGAVPLWIEGRAWRRSHGVGRRSAHRKTRAGP
jgi:hypothetical protein